MTPTTLDDPTMLDEEWLAAPRKRSRLTAVIAATLVASVFFLGGSLTQKHLGAGDAAGGAVGLPAGIPEGFPGAGGFPAGGIPDAAQQETGASSNGATNAEEQVIGTVIKKDGTVWLVEDLGGKRHEVAVANETNIIRELTLTPSKVEVGERVQIYGVERNDRLQAADITLR